MAQLLDLWWSGNCSNWYGVINLQNRGTGSIKLRSLELAKIYAMKIMEVQCWWSTLCLAIFWKFHMPLLWETFLFQSFIFCYITLLAVNLILKTGCHFTSIKLTALRYVKLAICRATWIAALIRQDKGNLIMAATLIPWCTPHINPPPGALILQSQALFSSRPVISPELQFLLWNVCVEARLLQDARQSPTWAESHFLPTGIQI